MRYRQGNFVQLPTDDWGGEDAYLEPRSYYGQGVYGLSDFVDDDASVCAAKFGDDTLAVNPGLYEQPVQDLV